MTDTPPNDTLRAVTVPPDTVASTTRSQREPAVVSVPPESLQPTTEALACALEHLPEQFAAERKRIDELMLRFGAVAEDIEELMEQTANHDRPSSIELTVNVGGRSKSDPPPSTNWSRMPRRWRFAAQVLGYVVAAAVSAALARFVPQATTTPHQPEKAPQNATQ